MRTGGWIDTLWTSRSPVRPPSTTAAAAAAALISSVSSPLTPNHPPHPQFLTDAISFDGLKKSSDYPGTLRGHFEKIYGGAGSAEFQAAQRNFAVSLAGYSLLSYLLAIKDRHNGNIMIDKKGHVIHIDFGFVLGIRPGGKFSFERPPFKLTREMVDILDGPNSELFRHYKELIAQVRR